MGTRRENWSAALRDAALRENLTTEDGRDAFRRRVVELAGRTSTDELISVAGDLGVQRRPGPVERGDVLTAVAAAWIERWAIVREEMAALMLVPLWNIEDGDGGWNGGDTVEHVCHVLANGLSFDLDHPAPFDEATGDREEWEDAELLRAALAPAPLVLDGMPAVGAVRA